MTHQRRATPQDIERGVRDARARGHVPVSRPLIGAVSLAAALGVLALTRVHTSSQLYALFESWSSNDIADITCERSILAIIEPMAWLCAPAVFAAIVAALVAGALQTAFLIAGAAVRPTIARLHPGAAIRRWMSVTSAVEGVRIAVSMALITAISWNLLQTQAVTLGQLPTKSSQDIAHLIISLTITLAGQITICLLAVAIVDGLWQRVAFRRAFRRQSVVVPDQRRSVTHRGLRMRRRKDDEFEKTPGTVYIALVASETTIWLAFCRGRDHTPRVVQRAHGARAASTLALKRTRHTNAYHAPHLVRALRSTAPGQPIPEMLFSPVATLFADALARSQQAGDE